MVQQEKPDPDLEAYANIRISHLHNAVARPAILPCAEIMKWIVDHVNLDSRTIVNAAGRHKCLPFRDQDLEEFSQFGFFI